MARTAERGLFDFFFLADGNAKVRKSFGSEQRNSVPH
jgi:hypothetical protein